MLLEVGDRHLLACVLTPNGRHFSPLFSFFLCLKEMLLQGVNWHMLACDFHATQATATKPKCCQFVIG